MKNRRRKELKRRISHLLIAASIVHGLSAFFMVAIGEAGQHESSETGASTSEPPSGELEKNDPKTPGWWQRHVTFGADLRAALAYNLRENRDGTHLRKVLPAARIRGGVTLSVTPWADLTARLATFFDKDTQDIDFRFSGRHDLRPGDVTFDNLFLTLRPHELLTIQMGRLQTEFEVDSVVRDSLSRHDSGGLDVNWTDGVHVIVGGPSSFKLHAIGQMNFKEGPTNGVGTRGPLDFKDAASRITYDVALEAPPFKPFTQLVADVTIIPQALRPFGLGTEKDEDVVAFAMRGTADFPLPWMKPVVLHPFGEFGVMASTPRENVLKVSSSRQRADPFAFVAGLDLKQLGPGSLGFQFGWTEAGYLISPDYPNNAWSIETRYKVPVLENIVFEIRYRHRQDIEKRVGALERQTDDNILGRLTVKF